jgi:hypothetical protein
MNEPVRDALLPLPRKRFSCRQIANSFFETGLKFYPDVGQFLADPIST